MKKYEKYFPKHRTIASIDLNAIVHNGLIAKKLFPRQLILSVLKADAYGHGISGVVPAYDQFTDWYAIATFEEAVRIREKSGKPVLLFGPIPADHIIPAAKMDLTFTIGSQDYAQMVSQRLTTAGLVGKCHLKIDTGLNRSGIRWRSEEALQEILTVCSLPGLEFTGIYTHLACGEGQEDWELAYTALQMERFEEACRAMKTKGLSLGIRHATSTGGALVHPAYRLDMVRLGMLPMGMSYSDESVKKLGLIPAMNWISYVAQVETVKAGEPISYSCTYHAEKDMRIGIVTCGYADGYRRAYSGKSRVIVSGKSVPVVGRIAMDYTMIDLTGMEDIKPGTPVVMLGTDADQWISAQQLSQFGESVSGEVTCVISNRVPRIYESLKGELPCLI